MNLGVVKSDVSILQMLQADNCFEGVAMVADVEQMMEEGMANVVYSSTLSSYATTLALSSGLASKHPLITASSLIANAATDGQAGVSENAATNNPTNATTNLSGLLITALTGQLNTTNTNLNTVAANQNAASVINNSGWAKFNALVVKYNDLATKVNTLWSWMKSQSLMAS